MQFVEVAYFNFYLEVLALLLAIFLGTGNGLVDTAGEVNMIVFQQNHVEQTDSMVYAATYLHSHLFQNTHARSRLTGIEHTGIRTFQLLGILMGHGSDAAHTLHNVQHQAFGLQQRLHLAFHNHSHVARLHFSTVIDEYFHFHGGVETTEHFFSYLDTGKNTGFFNQKLGFAHCRSRNARKGGMVTIAYIFGKGQVNQPVNQFFFLIHLSYLFLFGVSHICLPLF